MNLAFNSAAPATSFAVTATIPDPSGNRVRKFNPLSITWRIEKNTHETLMDSVTTNHTVYTLLATPLNATRLYQTVVDIGCRGADSVDSAGFTDDIYMRMVDDALWQPFTPVIPGVKRADGKEMKYWPEGRGTPTNTGTPPYFTTAELIKYQEGRCGAWGRLLYDVRQAQGFAVNLYGIKGAPILTQNHAYSLIELLIQPLRKGQGNASPPTRFDDHLICKVDPVQLFDPSYGWKSAGSDITTAKIAWEDKALYGFHINWLDINGFPQQEDHQHNAGSDECNWLTVGY